MDFDWNAAFNHPLTLMGAGMMAGADRTGGGFGGIGQGLMHAQRGLMQQQELEQQAASQRENAQWKQFQMEQARAKMAAEAERAKQLEAYGNATPQVRRQMGASLFPQQDFKSLIAGAAQPKPITEMGKLNRALQSGNITQPQYDALSANMLQAKTGHQSMQVDQNGNAVLQDKLAGTITFVAPTGEVKTVGLAQTGGPSVQETGIPEAQASPSGMEPVQAVDAADPFAQQEWTRSFKSMPTESQNKYTASQMVNAKVPGIIERVKANPEAFGGKIGGAYYLPEHMQEGLLAKGYEEYQQSQLTPEQAQARADVFREASAAINALSGAAVSEKEGKRLMRFLPKETDTSQQIVNKLESAMREAKTTTDALGKQFGIPSKDVGGGDTKWETSPSGVQYRWK